MDNYSEIVYRGYGPHQRKGGGFSTLGVKSQEALEQALNNGWFKTLPEAIEAHDNPEPITAPVVSIEPVVEAGIEPEIGPDVTPAEESVEVVVTIPEASDEPIVIEEVKPLTRDELVAKAKALGIKPHHKHSDATLLALIEKAQS